VTCTPEQIQETAVLHNTAVIICGDDPVLRRAIAAGFDVVGDWSPTGPSAMGGPNPTRKIALRRTVMTPLAGVADYFKGERAPEEWFA
jgi:hypothetical protein